MGLKQGDHTPAPPRRAEQRSWGAGADFVPVPGMKCVPSWDRKEVLPIRQRNSFRKQFPAYAVFSVFVLWLGALAATAYTEGMNLLSFLQAFSAQLSRPFALNWTPHSLKFLAGAMGIYIITVAFFCAAKENRRPGEEHGSAHWGSAKALCRKYRDKDETKNVILTEHVKMSLNSRLHLRNLLQVIVGGSGSGKSRYVVKPNVILANSSYIVTDPKGELLRSCGSLLLQEGYTLRVFDLIDPENSNCFNPFRYIRKDSDVFRLIDNFIKNTTPKNAQQTDPFWEKSEIALDASIMLYLRHEAPEREQTMEMVLTMIEYGGAKEEDDDYKSPSICFLKRWRRKSQTISRSASITSSSRQQARRRNPSLWGPLSGSPPSPCRKSSASRIPTIWRSASWENGSRLFSTSSRTATTPA